MTTEADARIVVDRLLREADWDIEDKSQVSTEEPTADGRADYLLKNTRTQPIAVAKVKNWLAYLLNLSTLAKVPKTFAGFHP